jgi:hypothetical protein
VDPTHAIAKIGDYEIPLIGIPYEACQMECDGCGEKFYLTDVTVAWDGQRCLCWICDCKDFVDRLCVNKKLESKDTPISKET